MIARTIVAFDLLRDALSAIFGLSELKEIIVHGSLILAVPLNFVHSEARSWSIPSEDPYEEAARQLLEQAPRSPEVDILEAVTPPWKRLLLTTPRPSDEVGESSATAAARQPGPTIETRLRDTEEDDGSLRDRAAVRAEIEVLRRERLAYEQESMETRQALARSEAHCRALEARVAVLETEVHRHKWQHQAADDLAIQHIMRTQALEDGARVDTLEDTGSGS
ncbi:hypothetical protein Tco_1132950 [Tanacetum coccineum]|uniref:Uncharacterized protein n=1 Tax=Tanacetum coccineum TaxID=301880 RepID=A0ABQ5JDC7_9ASTR